MLKFSKKLTKKFIAIDPKHRTLYVKNLKTLARKLNRLNTSMQKTLMPYKNQEVASFSNAFAYFLQENLLKNTTIISHSHESRLSIFKLLRAKKSIKKQQTKCLIATLSVPKKHLKTLTEGINIKTIQLDIHTGEYFSMMQNIATKVAQCLK
jgi:zinc transport system substrate-binding protein